MDSSGRGRQRDSEEKEVEEEAHEGERLISPRPEPWDGGRPEVMDARRAGAEEDEGGEKGDESVSLHVWKAPRVSWR